MADWAVRTADYGHNYIEVTVKVPKGDKCWIEGKKRLECFCPFRGGDDFSDWCHYLDDELPDNQGTKHKDCPAK